MPHDTRSRKHAQNTQHHDQGMGHQNNKTINQNKILIWRDVIEPTRTREILASAAATWGMPG